MGRRSIFPPYRRKVTHSRCGTAPGGSTRSCHTGRKMLHHREMTTTAGGRVPPRSGVEAAHAASGHQPGRPWISPLLRDALRHETRYLHREKQFLPEQPADGALIFHLQRHQEASESSESGPAGAVDAPVWFHECWRCVPCVQGRPRRRSQALRPTCGLRLLCQAVCRLPAHARGQQAAGGSHPAVRQCAQRPLEGRCHAHPARPNKGGSIRPGGAGPPCLRGNRTAPCPVRMDCRLFTALAVSGRLLRSGYMSAVRRGFIHIGGGALHSLFGSIYSALSSRRRTGVRLCSASLSCQLANPEEAPAPPGPPPEGGGGGVRGLVRGSEELPPELPPFRLLFPTEFPAAFAMELPIPLTTA